MFELKKSFLGYEVRAQFQLDVIGGKSQCFEIILVNLDKTVMLNKQNIYLGIKVKLISEHFYNLPGRCTIKISTI